MNENRNPNPTAEAAPDLDVIGYLADNDYELADDDEWADLVASGIGSLRVDWTADDLRVYRFNRNMAIEWTAIIGGVPDVIAIALIMAAEDELAADAGRPVSTRQINARKWCDRSWHDGDCCEGSRREWAGMAEDANRFTRTDDVDPEPATDPATWFPNAQPPAGEPRLPDTRGVRHPEITVKLLGTDGNAFAIIGTMQRELRRAGVPADEIKQFMSEATSGDYDRLLATCMRWVEVN